VQLHHKFYPKKLSSFEIRFLKGTEIAKWCRFPNGHNGAVTEELRTLELLIGRGQFRSEEFIVAEREGRFIGRLRARLVDGPLGYLILESPAVLEEFEFIEVAREFIECALETARAQGNIKCVRTQLSEKDSHYEELRRLYEHLGFVPEERGSVLLFHL